MEEDIKNYLPTIMFRGTPCTMEVTNMWNSKPTVRLNQTYDLKSPN